ncbi:MAG: GNAT family N-acetyltransferase [Myxococcaceae bacterium]
MTTVPVRRTARLMLRGFRGEDLAPLAALNADPRVMEHLRGPMGLQDSAAQLARFRQHWDEHGFGWWAVELPGVTPFIGWVGLARPRFEAHFTPCVEIGWRLAAAFWNQGYATEGAREALRFGWELASPRLEEIVAFTAPANGRSRRVMEKLGMRHDPADDFEHPNLPPGHPLRPHVLYRTRREVRGGTRKK